jgi:predicted PurR-regulated permease PerM
MFGELGEKIAYLALKLVILAALMGLAFIYIPRDSISDMAQTAVNWKNSVQTTVREQYPVLVSRIAAEAGELRAEVSKGVQNIKEQTKEASSVKIKAELNNWVDNLFKSK